MIHEPNRLSLGNIQEVRNEDADLSCSSYHDPAPEKVQETKLATNEAKAVTCLRIGLATVLLTTAILSAVGIYFFTSGLEQDEFEEAFDDNSIKVLEAFQTVADRRLGSIAAFASSVTAQALATNATWPFVTIPQFSAQTDHVRSLADIFTLTFVTIVEPEDRPKWENEFIPRAVEQWFAEDALYTNQSLDPGRYGGPPEIEGDYDGKPTESKDGVYEQIIERRVTPLGERGPMIAENKTFVVWWQCAPFSAGYARAWVNTDVRYDAVYGDVLGVLQRKKAAVGKTNTNSYGSQGMPITSLYYPVLTNFGEDARLAGGFVTIMTWDNFFINILPQNVKGLVAVLKNTCDQAFTFMINGPDVDFLGEGDLHDSAFNDMMRQVSFTELVNQGTEDGSYQGVPLDEQGCQYSLEVYASSEMEDDYISRMPIIYTVGSVLIFVFTSLVFVAYDRLVERRQRIVEKEAQKSGAIVSSLFPEAYKEKLMAEQERQLDKKPVNKMEASETTSKQLSSMMAGQGDEFIPIEDQIADLFPDCTVFFADIAGFTKWSSKRTPSEVFTLLQTLFGRFDRLAKRRNVFKIETIGDCYLAVTGLPNAQENHALIMAKYANECLFSMNETMRALSDTLGEDTIDLVLRVGLHSGPVTAGILKGEKSRFQVFGDTVNTASRMESTSLGGYVQVSSTTAELLRTKHNKEHWLLPREDLVQPKGKEPMQTYWLMAERTATSHASTHFTAASSSASKAYPAELYSKPT